MKSVSVLLSVVLACASGLVAAAPSADSTYRRNRIVTFYSQPDYAGLNYTLFDNRLDYCVNFTRGPLITDSARLFHNTVCDLYSEQGCTTASHELTIVKDTPDTGRIDLFSMNCTTVIPAALD